MNRAVDWLRNKAGDLLIAALTVGTAFELALTSVDYDRLVIPFALLAGPVLLLRRRFPLAAPTATYAALAIAATIDPSGLNDLSFPFFCALAAMAVFGASEDRRVAYAGIAIALSTLGYVGHKFHNGVSDFAWITGFFLAAWVVGYVLALRARQTSELRARAEHAEREREARALTAVANERARIARELHDVVAHSMSVMVVQAAGVRRLLREDQDREREALLTVERVGREALTEMRRMLGVLRASGEDATLTPQPGLEHLDRLLEQVRRAGLDVDLEVTGEPVALPTGLGLSAYRILQESLTNALKHGDRTRAHVRLRYAPDELELEVVDGTGAVNGARDGGHGLVGMRERVAVYGGEIEAGPRAEGGYRVRARLPLSGTA